ncbi:rRNA small subunit methyltransferase H [Fructilactobacillus florum 8D]|uniref:Ribosomal RNA small subunit methyltransferase H n=1 Tax=Fructilactobacillus florum 8D TaxID=1221538 RepID=W9ECX4_9LACO|nr:16S rRNA (cytosine(1402)-N(4))-methyltransferase RsmH [Fructilactobacillus florum]EKK20324.1 rRNA small subunit methyltransferase H [Fructilactobacillus florum 2F]ETO39963.1 rRNA small subunit methyltransferase H [Fructilactobacillus florum 8D]
MTEFKHQTVLLTEAVDELSINPAGIYVDCTLGGGGHSRRIAERLETGHLFAFDQDEAAITYNQSELADQKQKITFLHENFRNLKKALQEQGISEVDGIVYDLGVSSPQLDEGARGFSYQQAARLDMRMDRRQHLDAWEVINHYSYQQLVRIFYRYGEEKFAKPIARRIEQIRTEHPIDTTTELADIVKSGIPAAARRHGGNPAKRVFQAVRIAVNDELGALESSLEQALQLLKLHGRLSVITFQSLEDRLVKGIFREKTTIPDLPANLPVIPPELKPNFKLPQKKPILPSQVELDNNHRAHSARLRVIERIK